MNKTAATLLTAAFLALVAGAAAIYWPAGLIVAGLLLATAGVLALRTDVKAPRP